MNNWLVRNIREVRKMKYLASLIKRGELRENSPNLSLEPGSAMGEKAKNAARSNRTNTGERIEQSETTSRLASLADNFFFHQRRFFLLFPQRSLLSGYHNLNHFNKIIFFRLVLKTCFLNRKVRMTTQSLVEHF